MSVKRPTSRLPTYHFGRAFPQGTTDGEAALHLFLDGYVEKSTGRGRFEFFQLACKRYLPSVRWDDPETGIKNHWLEAQVRSLCDDTHCHKVGNTSTRFIYWTGCAAAGKTFGSGLFATLWWFAAPTRSCVTLTSTTKAAIGARVWPVIQRIQSEIQDPATGEKIGLGHLIDSKRILQSKKGDDLHAIHAQAVEKGDIHKAVEGIKGRHCERIMLVIDEFNTTPAAIPECIHNMSKGCKELVVLGIGNAWARLDNHGRCCEPVEGWSSIDITTGKWRTKAVEDWGMDEGFCVHFDGNDSPNVRAKRTIFPFLYTYENFLRRKHGSKSPQFWSQERGFWPPEGTTHTVLNEVMLMQHDAMGAFTFDTQSRGLASLDPGFGGDKCVATFGHLGDVNGRQGLGLDPKQVIIETDVTLNETVDHQIARQFQALCEERRIPPEHAIIDATGIGRGVYAFASEFWSPRVVRYEGGSAVGDQIASADDPRPANQVYDRFVTMVWWFVRELVVAGQLRGMPRDAALQFCAREYKQVDRRTNRIDTKEECKLKTGRSPDNADGVAMICHMARKMGLNALGGGASSRNLDWSKLTQELTMSPDSAYRDVIEIPAQWQPDAEPWDLEMTGLQ